MLCMSVLILKISVFPGIEASATNSTIELILIPSTSIIPSLSYLIHFQVILIECYRNLFAIHLSF